MCSREVDRQAEGLEIERDRLQNAVLHLQRSNQELEDALKRDGPDADLRDAIGENIVIIARYKGQIERLNTEIRKARGEVMETSNTQTASVPVQNCASANSSIVPHTEDMTQPNEDDSIWM